MESAPLHLIFFFALIPLMFVPLTGAYAQSAAEKILATRFAAQVELATKGDLDAQLDVATAYEHGSGVEKNITEAVRWYEAAAAQSSPLAMHKIGSLVHDRYAWDDISDEAKAAMAVSITWFQRAAETGYAPAQNSLGLMYGLGDRVELDRVRGRMWLFVAEANGHVMQGSLIKRLEEHLSDDERAVSLSLAEACIASGYSKCD